MIGEIVQLERTTARKVHRASVLLPGPSIDSLSIDTFDGCWWVVHTKSRNEKALAADLDRRGIQHFLPLARLSRRHGGRMTKVSVPLFPGYLFVCGDEGARYATLENRRVAKVIGVFEQEGLRKDLRQIARAISSDVPVDMYPGIRRGRRCRVIGGNLAGLEGVVLRRRGVCRVYLAVEILGQSAEVDIDPALLDIIE